MIAIRIVAAAFACLSLLQSPVAAASVPSGPGPSAAGDRDALSRFRDQVREYDILRKTIEREQGSLVGARTPEEFDRGRQKLTRALIGARRDAGPGDIFEPPIQRHIRGVLERLFTAPDGEQLRSSIRAAHTGRVVVAVNRPYPSKSPLSTMPLRVLDALPALPEDLEYRFVGQSLVLYDARARMIVDYMEAAFP